MEGDGVLLVFADDLGFLLQTAHNAVHRIQEILVGHQLSVFAGGEQGRFVAHVGDVRPAEARRLLGQELDVHRGVRFDRAQVHLEDGLSLHHVGHVDVDLAVETPGTHQRAVQDVRTVGRRENDDPTVGAKSVHLCQELVQGVFALVVGPEACILSTGTPNGVNLVDEDDGRGLLLGLLEQIADAGRPHADEHLHKVGAAQTEERHLGLAGHGLRQQRLARARRAHKQCAFGNLGPELGVLSRLLQEVHDFVQFLLGAVHTRHVLERHVGALAVFKDLGLGLADVEDLSAARRSTAQPPHQEHPHHDHQAEENDPREDLAAPFVGGLVAQVEALAFLQLLQFGLVRLPFRNVHARIRASIKRLQQLRVGLAPVQAVSDHFGEVEVGARAVVADPCDLAFLRHFFEVGPLNLALGGGIPHHHHREQEHGNNGVHPVEIHLAARLVALLLSLARRGCVLVVHCQSVVLWCSAGASPHSSSSA